MGLGRAHEGARRRLRRLRRKTRRRLRGQPPGGPARRGPKVNNYRFAMTDEQIVAGGHRRAVGGSWTRIGQLQLEFMQQAGLRPDSYLLDVGCGALRGGVHFVRVLDPGHYFGVDMNASLIRAGREKELVEAGVSDRVPEGNLRVTDLFDCDFGVPFDFAIAVSVFSHLPLNQIRVCLERLGAAMAPGGRFYATFFEVPEGTPLDRPVEQRRVTTYSYRDPFHYSVADMTWAGASAGGAWQPRHLGDWGHPRGQQMMEYTRI